MGMKVPLNEPHGAIRNASNDAKKVAHNKPIRNQSVMQKGGVIPTAPYICNESAPMKGKKKG